MAGVVRSRNESLAILVDTRDIRFDGLLFDCGGWMVLSIALL